MHTNKATLAAEYYTLLGQKNAEGIKKYLHPDVELSSPLAKVIGKEAVLKAAEGFMSAIKSLTIRTRFESQNQAMLVLDTDMHGVGTFPTASLVTFQDELIVKIELFYDGGRLVQKKEEIFS